MDLMTKEQYQEWINKASSEGDIQPQWSEPMYICPKCNNGGMQKNLWTCRTIHCMPEITEHEYRCNVCGHTEYLRG